MRPILVKLSQNHMATTFDLSVSCEDARAKLAERLLADAHARVADLEDELSEFRPHSSVGRLNASRAGDRVPVSKECVELLERAERVFARTDGAFDPTFRSGYRARDLREKLEWSASDRWIAKKDERVKLGFGAIGKGFAIDGVRELLEREGFHDYRLIAGGSSLFLSGLESPGRPWRIGWSWKKDARGSYFGQEFFHRDGKPVAIGISGSLEQGEHIAHSTRELISTWVSGSSATEADALSTALYVLGWEAGYEKIADPLARLAIAAITRDETPYWNGHFQKNFGAPRTGAPESRSTSNLERETHS